MRLSLRVSVCLCVCVCACVCVCVCVCVHGCMFGLCVVGVCALVVSYSRTITHAHHIHTKCTRTQCTYTLIHSPSPLSASCVCVHV